MASGVMMYPRIVYSAASAINKMGTARSHGNRTSAGPARFHGKKEMPTHNNVVSAETITNILLQGAPKFFMGYGNLSMRVSLYKV
jgi:hypothetical protein